MPQEPDIEALAIKSAASALTAARKRLILALPADGSWGAAPSRGVAKRLWWNFGYGLVLPIIDHKHCPENRNEWALTPFGQRVAAYLKEQSNA